MAQRKHSTVIFGCGNTLLGDDGFGPAVIEELKTRCVLPEDSVALDVGTGIREYLFDYLLDPVSRPERLIILDAVDFPDRIPGEVFVIDISMIPVKKIHDFSLHQFPTINLLSELQEHTGIRIDIVAAQVEFLPKEICSGLSSSMVGAVSRSCEKIVQLLSESNRTRCSYDV
jgi:coenzyme F420 hydrogenase subunit delta